MKESGLSSASAVTMCALLIVSLGSSKPAQAELSTDLLWQEGKPLVTQDLDRGGKSGFDKPVVLYVSSEEEWDRAMKRLLKEGALWCLPLPQAPSVEWDKKSVLLVALGRRAQENSSVQINEVRLHGNQLLADVTVTVPTELESKHLYFPYHMVQIDDCEAASAKVKYSYDVLRGLSDSRSAQNDRAAGLTADG